LTQSFFNLVHNEIEKMEALMRSQAEGSHPDLQAALNLLLSAGGKRIRPTVTLLTGKMLGASTEPLVTLAAAVELLHTATLVHDDLIDGAILRRGSQTLNAKWSPGATVLTGDFIFSRSARLAAETNSVELMKVFAQTLTIIVNGEISQLFSSRCQPDRANYDQRIYAKTASLFETSTCTAAMISPANAQTVEEMRRYGYNIGIAFQIIDDILDFTGEQATLGKPVGSDLRQGIITLPAIFYITDHPEDDAVKALVAGQCLDLDQAQTMVEAIRRSSAIQKAHDEARLFIQQALKELNSQPDCPERQALSDLANYIVNRRL
jgi:geranylgeranyl pyrophosphate synthase